MARTTSGAIIGAVDDVLSHRDLGYAGKRFVVIPGDTIVVRGWAHDSLGACGAVFALVEAERHSLNYGLLRPDVSATNGVSAYCGFEGTFRTTPELGPSGSVQVRLLRKDGTEAALDSTAEWVIPSSVVELKPRQASTSLPGRIRFVRDTIRDGYPPGWSGRRTIRSNALLHAEGWIVGQDGQAPDAVLAELRGATLATAFTTHRIADGEVSALLPGANHEKAGFRVIADTRNFEPGLYELTVYAQFDDDLRAGPSALFQIAPLVPFGAPQFLPTAMERAHCTIKRCAPLDVLMGEPIAIQGSAIDPATRRGGNVFVAFDHYRPMPVTSIGDTEFSGIADTGDLPVGEHVLRILLLNEQSALWYELGRYEVNVRGNSQCT